MRFNVSQLLKEGVGARRRHSLDETFEALPESGTTKARGEVVLTRIDKGIWVSGDIATNACGTCSRCLAATEYWIRFHVDEEYLPTVDIDTGAPISVTEAQDGTFTLDSHHTLDLSEAVRQYVIINLPMKPLCKEECAGLCSTCGANLNDHPCGCFAATDARWSPLLDLLTTNGKR